MNRPLIATPAYLRSLRRFLKKHPHAAADVQQTLTLLEADAFQPSLKTHKLHGKLEGHWACSGGYDLRIVFLLSW